MAPFDTTNSPSNVTEIDKTLEYLKEGKDKIQLLDRYRDVTLVLGITGAGKSTFVQWLAGDNSEIFSELVPGSENEYIVKDQTRISNSTTQSMTIYPELVVDPVTDTAYYDCPGFSDTRSVSVDIAGTYFIKSVADHAQNIRMIFTIGYNAVRVGMDRRQFTELLKHSTNLVKNVDKFSKSIALVVTKVENSIVGVDANGKFVYMSDQKVINTIANFIKSVKEELQRDNATGKNENLIKFIDVLLQGNGQQYSKIAIFRRPDMAGPLSEIPLLQQGKARLMEMIKQLQLSPIEKDDFGYSISGDSKSAVHDLSNILNERVWKEAELIAEVVAAIYRQSLDEIHNKIGSFVTATLGESVEANLVEAQSFAAKLKATDRIVSELSVPRVTTKELADKLNYTLTALNIDSMRDNVERISLDATHLEFLQNVTDSMLVTKPWENLLKTIMTPLASSKEIIQTKITESAGKLATTVQSTISVLANDLLKAKLQQVQLMDIQELPAQLEQQVAMLRRQTEPPPVNIKQLATLISKNVESLGLETGAIKINTLSLFNTGKYLTYLQALSDQTLNTWSPEWISPLRPTVKSITDSLNWYRFLNALYEKLGEYQFQQDTSRYNVRNVDDWGEGQSKQSDIQIGEQNFKPFLNKLGQYNLPALDEVRDTPVAQWQLNELNQVLSLTLKHGEAKPICTAADGKLVVTGDYVKFSDLKKTKLVDLCKGISKVNIFASNTVFIDSDLDGMGAKLNFTLMAPKWEVVGKRTINLDGAAAEPLKTPKASNSNSAATVPTKGETGFAGGAAGTFIGFAQQYVNREDLTISANGGVGGNGQEGGDGGNGEKGTAARGPDEWCHYHDRYEVISTRTEMHGFTEYNYTTYMNFGTDGTSGGIGGEGGNGASGGTRGAIELFNLDDPTNKEQIETHHGAPGTGGNGGLGGYDGPHGDDKEVNCEIYFTWGFWTRKVTGQRVIEHGWSKRAPSGSKGANGKALESEAPKIYRPADAINEYKKYLRTNLDGVNDRFKRNTTIALLDRLDKSTHHLYDTLALAGELEGLEEQSRSLSNKQDSIHLYQSLSSRINTYVGSFKANDKSVQDQYRKAFNYLSAAVLSKLYNLRSGSESNLIVDVEGYLKYVQENMNTLNQLREKHNEHLVVQAHKQKYHESIEKEIQEAKDFIANDIEPEFDKIGTEIKDKIDRLIADIVEMEKEAEKNKKELEERRQQLQKQLVLRSVFTAISAVSKVASFAGPHGAAIGTVLGGVGTIAEGFAIGDDQKDVKEFEMPPGIKDNIKYVEKEYKSFFEEPAEELKLKLNLLLQETRDEPELSDLTESLESIRSSIPSFSSGRQSYWHIRSDNPSIAPDGQSLTEAVQRADEQVKKTVWQKAKELLQKDLSDRSKTILEYSKKVVDSGTAALERYKKHRGDSAKIAATDKAIKGVEDKIKQIEAYKKAITSTMAPDMDKLMGKIQTISNNLDNKSLVALDIQQWKAQGMLKNLKLQILKFLKGQEVEADMMRCFEKLEEAMAINIKLYDRIQNFQEQQKMTDFIANVNSPTATSIRVGDPELARVVDKLEILIRANVVLQQFDSTVAAIKQTVFPYARHYLGTLTLPSKLSLNDAYIDEMVENANAVLDQMKLKLVENETKISEVDENTLDSEFDSTKPCIQAPYYVWSNDRHPNVLAELLSGEPVSLIADIRASDPTKDAIKFRKVELNFRAKNPALQPEIDATLEKFKIIANHTGNSNYRYGGKYYVIDHKPLNIEYSYARRSDGSPVESSLAYSKIQKGSLTLSPYAMWKIQLSQMNRTMSFDQLAKFRDAVDLELVGPGRYIKSQVALNDDLKLDRYYKEYVDVDDDAVDNVVEQAQNEHMFSMQMLKQMNCRKYMSMYKASNSLHRFSETSLPNEANNSYISRIGQTVSNFFGGRSSATQTSTHIAHPRFEYTSQQSNDNTNSLSEASNSVDVNGNLLMGQLLVGLIAGKNNTIASDTYLSPEQSREVQVERLAQRVVPALSSDTRFRSNQIHNRNNQWHRDWNSDNSRKQN